MIDLPTARTITPADVTLPPTVHVDITWVLEEAGSPTSRSLTRLARASWRSSGQQTQLRVGFRVLRTLRRRASLPRTCWSS